MGHEKHKGDMGNLKTDKNGNSQMTISLPDTTLDEVIGKAVLVHAAPDDFKTQPSGNSGARIACGLVRPIE
jgi:Cu-Zn family superoxide dismutase